MTDRASHGSELLDGLAGDLGEAAVDALLDAFGGRRLYVAADGEGKIAKLIGENIAAWLAAHYGGERILVPSRGALKARRNLAAQERFVAARPGWSAGDLAHALDRSDRTIREIRKRLREKRAAQEAGAGTA